MNETLSNTPPDYGENEGVGKSWNSLTLTTTVQFGFCWKLNSILISLYTTTMETKNHWSVLKLSSGNGQDGQTDELFWGYHIISRYSVGWVIMIRSYLQL